MGTRPFILYDQLFQEISKEHVSGTSLVADPAYRDLLRDAKGTPEKKTTVPAPGHGAGFRVEVVPGQDPDWEQIRDDAISVLCRSHDVIASGWYCVSLLALNGVAGLADGLAALHWMVENRWETFHPQPVPEHAAPMRGRVLAIEELAVGKTRTEPKEGEGRDNYSFRLVRRVRQTPLVRSSLGDFSLASMQIAAGKLPVVSEGETPPDMRSIAAAWVSADLAQLEQTRQDIQSAIAAVNGIVSVFVQRSPPGTTPPNMDALTEVLGDALKHLSDAVLRKRKAERPVDDSQTQAMSNVAAQEILSTPGAAPNLRHPLPDSAIPDRATTPAEVRQLLDAALAFYEHDEERWASPVPLFLRVAKSLMCKRYTDLSRQLDPATIKTITEWSRLDQPSKDRSDL